LDNSSLNFGSHLDPDSRSGPHLPDPGSRAGPDLPDPDWTGSAWQRSELSE